MTRRTQFIVLGVLLAALAATAFNMYRTRYGAPAAASPAIAPDAKFTPLDVDNPALRLDILKRFLALQYKGGHRNIFSAALPPPPAARKPVNTPPPVTLPPPPPPRLTVDAKYFGYVSDTSGEHRRAFFDITNNDDIVIASEGDTLLGRFRVVRLTSSSADLEEVSTGRRATLTLEEPGPNG